MAETSLLKPQKLARQSNFELLRILFMLIIVANHLRGYGGVLEFEGSHLLSRWLLLGIGWGGYVGVNGFVLISGYFLCTSRSGLQPKRLLKLFLQIFFYSAGIYLVCVAAGWAPWNLSNSLRFFLPISNKVFWFATIYFFLFLLSPFLNMVIHKLDRRQYRLLLLILFVIFCLLPSVYRVKYDTPELVWFVFLYFAAGYIRLHPSKWFEKDKKWLALGMSAVSYAVILSYQIHHLAAHYSPYNHRVFR